MGFKKFPLGIRENWLTEAKQPPQCHRWLERRCKRKPCHCLHKTLNCWLTYVDLILSIPAHRLSYVAYCFDLLCCRLEPTDCEMRPSGWRGWFCTEYSHSPRHKHLSAAALLSTGMAWGDSEVGHAFRDVLWVTSGCPHVTEWNPQLFIRQNHTAGCHHERQGPVGLLVTQKQARSTEVSPQTMTCFTAPVWFFLYAFFFFFCFLDQTPRWWWSKWPFGEHALGNVKG